MSVKIYKEHHSFNPVQSKYTTQLLIEDIDTFGAAYHHQDTCCLNFASHRRPGGGYKAVQDLPMPIKTQEEDLFRRSNLPDIMDNAHVRHHYPLTGIMGIYCNNVVIERDERLCRHDPYYTAVITVPAVVNPDEYDKPLIEARAQRILDIAADNNHPTLILGAWGCGVFNNNPHNIAELFKRLLKTDYNGVFETVVFAIPGKTHQNYQIFESVLTS